MYIIRPYQIVHHAITRHTRYDIMPKRPKTGPFTASRVQMTVGSSVFVDAISVKNVVRFVTRFDIMNGSLYKVPGKFVQSIDLTKLYIDGFYFLLYN